MIPAPEARVIRGDEVAGKVLGDRTTRGELQENQDAARWSAPGLIRDLLAGGELAQASTLLSKLLAKDLVAPVKSVIRRLVTGGQLTQAVRFMNRLIVAGHRPDVVAIVRSLVRMGRLAAASVPAQHHVADVQGAAIDSSCRSPIMNLVANQQTPRAAEGEAKVITLCGSTKFEAEFAEVNPRLMMDGCVVISLGMFSLPELPDYDWTADCSELKGRLGAMHCQKIRMADEVYIVDPGDYVGDSTRREIAYAESLGKPVRNLSRERSARTGDGPQE